MKRTFNGPVLLSQILIVLILFFLNLNCANKSFSENDKKAQLKNQVNEASQILEDESKSDLTKVEAEIRSKKLSNIKYFIEVDLSEPTDEYSATLNLNFDLNDITQDLRVDFYQGQILSMTANGLNVPATAKKNYWITLPKEVLKKGFNTVNFKYKQKYFRTGDGLHRFKDPEDQQYYLHTQFETFDANKFLPCFDQPDLRSTFILTVIAPEKWQVVTSTRELSKKMIGNNKQVWNFPASKKISTYIFSLHAGPYQVFEDSYLRSQSKKLNNNSQSIKLRLFVRPALAKYVDAKFWFDKTKQGLAFFESYFQTSYPFENKYDQLIVPEFNAGGMENAAAVTYSERFITRSTPTRDQLRSLTSVMMHEMAHMWFGDLVTMKWWNDLWLNETFATYMAELALNRATEFTESWQDFSATTKLQAYIQDSLSTTHPIESEVNRVKEAFGTFDSITYNKGASVFHQLTYYMTEQAFRKGLQDYFKKYSYGNTTLEDFIGSLQKFTKLDLTLWSDRWLKQSGTDEVYTNWKCNGSKLSEIEVKIIPTNGRKFRPQALLIGLIKNKNNQLDFIKSERVVVNSEKAVKIKGQWICPDFILPNQKDYGYVNINLSDSDLDFLKNNISKFTDLTTRSMLWNNMWRSVRETKYPLKKYAEMINAQFKLENDQIILDQIFNTLSQTLYYWPELTQDQVKAKNAFRFEQENFLIERLKSLQSGDELEKIYFDYFLRIAQSEMALNQLNNFFIQGKISEKFLLDNDRAWRIAIKLSRFKHPAAAKVFSTLKQKDNSQRGQTSALSFNAIRPNLNVKNDLVNTLLENQSQMSLQEKFSISNSLFPPEQANLKKEFNEKYYSYFNQNKRTEDETEVFPVLSGLLPLNCEKDLSERFKKSLSTRDAINPNIMKNLTEALDEDIRCQKIRETSAF